MFHWFHWWGMCDSIGTCAYISSLAPQLVNQHRPLLHAGRHIWRNCIATSSLKTIHLLLESFFLMLHLTQLVLLQVRVKPAIAFS